MGSHFLDSRSLDSFQPAVTGRPILRLSGLRRIAARGASLNTGPRTARQSRPRARCIYIYVGSALLLALLAGCASSGAPVVGPIEFVDSSGTSVPPLSSLAVNGVVYLVATVTNDNEQLGVSWTANCGSLPPGGGTNGVISTVCGAFSPGVTASGPVPTYPSTGIIAEYSAPSVIPKGNTVTITAHAVSLPSVTSSVTLTIVAAGQAATPAIESPAAHSAKNVESVGL